MSEPSIAWYRTPIDPAALKELTRRSDAKGLAQGLAHLAVVAATAFFTWWSVGRLAWPLVVLAFFLHGTVLAFLGGAGAMHELSHGTPFRSRWLNEVFLAIASFLTWSNPALFRASHARHHQYTVHRGLDLEVVLPGRFRLRDFLWQLAFNPVGVYHQVRNHVRLALGRLEGEWENRLLGGTDAASVKAKAAVVAWARAQVLGHLALGAVFGAIGQWILVPIVLAPFYAGWLAILCAIPQHLGMKGDVPDWRLSCRTVLINPVFRFLYWNMAYHVEHHMYAAVPFHALGKLHRLIAKDSPKPCRGLAGAWREVIDSQRRQRTEPAYVVDPWKRGG
jgi:fatty acid desaturase